MTSSTASSTNSAALIAGFLKAQGVDRVSALPLQTEDSAWTKGALTMSPPLRTWALVFISGWFALMGSPSLTYAQAANSLAPLGATQWTREHAAHLLERAGFGGTPEEIDKCFALGLEQAVKRMIHFSPTSSALPPFDHSGIFEEGLDPFPPSRPAATDLAKAKGEAMGIVVKPNGNRPIQPVVNKFFYWLRASRLETDRVAYWWADRMLRSDQPLVEKMALFWHGHFATNEDKVRDYRKNLALLNTFQEQGMGDMRSLLIAVSQSPAMLAFLDAGVNVKGAPNENFAREIMELFTMGVGHYSEQDIREAARAFTGWNYQDLKFVVNADKHDADTKTLLGQQGKFDGVQVIDVILKQPVTAKFLAEKMYRYFVRDDISPELSQTLADKLRRSNYAIKPFLETLFMSQDFYAPPSVGSRIKSPVELAISTYKKLGLNYIPGAPDLNETTARLGQKLLNPPTVAGWSYGKAWITPSLLMERGNFALDLLFPDVASIAYDRYAMVVTGEEVRAVQRGIRAGLDITNATRPAGAAKDAGEPMALSNKMADSNEAFNTRYGAYRGWQMAIEKVKPIPREFARLNLSEMIRRSGAKTTLDVVTYFENRFMSVALDGSTRQRTAEYLKTELGSDDVRSSLSFAEEALRQTLHILLSRPEYQLG